MLLDLHLGFELAQHLGLRELDHHLENAPGRANAGEMDPGGVWCIDDADV